MDKKSLTNDELERYDRQLIIPNWDKKGQLKLKNNKITIIGVGGLGSVVSLYLAAVGIGTIHLIDNDTLDLSNLNRQILYNINDLGKAKALIAQKKLNTLNPEINVIGLNKTLDENNINDLLSGMDLIVDCLDNFPTRYLLNKFCVKNNIPFVHGAIYGLEGRVMFIDPNDENSPCLGCFYPEEPPESTKFPVLGSSVGITASIEATEAIKYLVGIGENLIGKFLIIDGKPMEFKTIEIKKNANCTICGNK